MSKRGVFLEGLRRFYHDDVIMQENSEKPRVGLAASLALQQRAQEATGTIYEVKAATILVDGERACIERHAEWMFEDGIGVRVEETALQIWDGDRIRRERFFYDSAPIQQAFADG